MITVTGGWLGSCGFCACKSLPGRRRPLRWPCACSAEHEWSCHPLSAAAGGKWTTYRLMAQDAIDRAVAEGRLQAGACSTAHLKLIGAGVR
jgi:hypothetical protein